MPAEPPPRGRPPPTPTPGRHHDTDQPHQEGHDHERHRSPFRRTPPVTQYGSADLKHMTPEEIAAAEDAGHLHDLIDGRDPDATVDHEPGCTKPAVRRDLRDTRTVRLGDPVTYYCPNCDATKEI